MKLINCDLGECLIPDPDSQIMPLIDMANIACGGHIGDHQSMMKTIQLAKQHDVTVGAHPSYPDKANFGRKSIAYSADELFNLLLQQLIGFDEICQSHEVTMSYLKPHGALYHDMMTKPVVFSIVCDVLTHFDSDLSLVVQAGTTNEHLQTQYKGLLPNLIFEAFADRGYKEGKLIPRSEDGALLENAEEIVEQYHHFGTQSFIKVDTVCFHSDHLPSVQALQILKSL